MKKCKKCGKEINDWTEVCLYCGAKQSDFAEDISSQDEGPDRVDSKGANSSQEASSSEPKTDIADEDINLKGTKWSNNGGESTYENRGADGKGQNSSSQGQGFSSQGSNNQGTGFNNQGAGNNYNYGNQGQNQNMGGGGYNDGNYNQFVPIKKQQFIKFFLLSLVTFGIYGIYYGYQFVKDVNRLCEGDGRESKNFIVVLLLNIITFGIYGCYWIYVQGERLKDAGERNGIKIHESGIVLLLLWLLGGELCHLIAIYILFDNTNRLASVYNGYESREQVNARPSNNAPILIGAILTAIALGFVLIITANLIVAPDDGPADRISKRVEQNAREIPEVPKEDGTFGYDFDDDESTANLVLNVVNNTDFDIVSIEALHKKHADYDESLLDDNFILAKGASASVPFGVYKEDPNYTFEIIDEKGDEVFTNRIDFSKVKTNNPTLEIYKDGEDVRCQLK